MNLRMLGLSAVVVFTALLPLAASAGPAGSPADGSVDNPLVNLLDTSLDTSVDSPADADTKTPSVAKAPGDAKAVSPARTAERCGPEVTSPEGIEAQTCVLTLKSDTWARTYYRNTSGAELLAALSLMGPSGRTVQTHCAVEAQDDPATCETPKEPSAGTSAQYTAVAEFAAPVDGTDVGPLLLRSGSNSTKLGGR